MKFFVVIFLILIFGSAAIGANPFSTKNRVVKPIKKIHALDGIIYKGYAFVGDTKIAIVQYMNNQYTLSVGDLIEKGVVTEIRRNYIKYKLHNQEFKTSIVNDEED